MLRFNTPSNRPPAEPLVVADPHFDLAAEDAAPSATNETQSRRSRDFTRGDHHFDRLPGTREEGEHIGRLLGVSPWLHADALEARLKQRRSPRILHLATHGFFLADQERDPNREVRDFGGPGRLSGPPPENPLLRSGLALAGANAWLNERPLPPEAEDGLLTAEDVSGLDLLDTELVVLSACETGLGEIRTGEGVFGLRRAFVLAGAKALVMSLWKVPDDATRLLMKDFYRRLLAGEGKADALRDAQRTLREKPEYADPFYWGAFICQGDPGPLAPVQPPRRVGTAKASSPREATVPGKDRPSRSGRVKSHAAGRSARTGSPSRCRRRRSSPAPSVTRRQAAADRRRPARRRSRSSARPNGSRALARAVSDCTAGLGRSPSRPSIRSQGQWPPWQGPQEE